MKKFETIKVIFEAHISVRTNTSHITLKDMINEKLRDKLEMICTDNGFGYAEPETFLETEND